MKTAVETLKLPGKQISRKKFAIVLSQFNEPISKRLLSGAMEVLEKCGVKQDDISVYWVPGSFEIPLAVKSIIQTETFSGVIALGCIIKGKTTHDQYIAASCSRGIMQVMLESGIPIGFGILTTLDEKQALERSNHKDNKGRETALTVIKMIEFVNSIESKTRKSSPGFVNS